MKIRIKGNSVRLRLTRPEVETFASTGTITEAIHFGPGQQLNYALRKTSSESKVHASFDAKVITVHIPEQIANDWAEGHDVGFEQRQPLPDGESLLILVEKDFQCLTSRKHEEESDQFPNPLAQS